MTRKNFLSDYGGIAVLFLGISLAVIPACAETKSPSSAVVRQEKRQGPAPVTLKGEVIFTVSERLLSFSPEERAVSITERLRHLYEDARFDPGSISLSEGEISTDIVADGRAIMSVTDADARKTGKSRQQLAKEYAQTMRTALAATRKSYGLHALLLGLLFALIATAVLAAFFVWMSRFFPRAYAELKSWLDAHIGSVKIQNHEVLPARYIAQVLLGAARAARLAIIVLLCCFYILLVFSFFPWTSGFASTLFDYILSPSKDVLAAFISFIPNAFTIAVIAVITRYVIRLVRFIFVLVREGKITLPDFHADWAEPTYKIVRFFILAFAAIVIFPYLPGSQSPIFRGVSVFLGILFSLGSTSAVANMVAGVVLTYMRPFSIGDRVKVSDTVGDVMEKTLLVTRIKTIKNVGVTIPNAMVLGSHIINYSSSVGKPGLILNAKITLGYDAPWRRVHELLIAAAQATDHILPEPKPFVLQTSLDDFTVSYELNAYTAEPNRMIETYSFLHQNIQDKFNEAGIEIMSPTYEVRRRGPECTIPEEYRKPKA